MVAFLSRPIVLADVVDVRKLFMFVRIGKFVAFGMYLSQLTWPLIALGWVINLFERGAASMGRLMDIFRVEPRIVLQRIKLGHRAKAAAACAAVAQNHEGRRAAMKTFVDIRAARRFANRVQPETP